MITGKPLKFHRTLAKVVNTDDMFVFITLPAYSVEDQAKNIFTLPIQFFGKKERTKLQTDYRFFVDFNYPVDYRDSILQNFEFID